MGFGKLHGNSSVYWANLQNEELGGALWGKVEDYRQYLTTSGQLVLWQNLFEAYYREYWMQGTNEKGGSNAQYTHTHINQFKSILERLQSIISQQRIKWQARAANGDSQSLKQTILANELLDYYLRTKNLTSLIANVVDWGFLLGEGFLALTWDSQGGKLVGQTQEEDGSMIEIHQGDVRASVYDPTCVVRDAAGKSWDACDWIITIEQRNKYDEATKYPELADKLVSLTMDKTNEMYWHFQPNWWFPSDDAISVYHFYHKRTPACPDGRYVKFYADDMVVIQTGLPYEEIPVHRFAPQEHLGTAFGYSVATNLLPIQQSYDVITDSIQTNHEIFGVQSVIGYEGSNFQWQTIANGLTYMTVDPVAGVPDSMPKPLNLLDVAPDSYAYQQTLVQMMQTISGVNSVARGEPPEGVTAGTALALIQSMALQTNMPAQLRYATFLEHAGSGLISLLRVYASVPRMAEIAGKENRSFVKEFSNKDLNQIQRVFVELGNPLTDTVPGRLAMAQDLLNQHMISTPQEYLTVLKTGTLDPMLNGDEAELLLIRKENELLSEGQPALVLEMDAHQIHITEHRSVLADPETRNNPDLVKNVMAHIQAHQQFLAAAAMPAPGAPAPAPAAPPGPQKPGAGGPAAQVTALSNPGTSAATSSALAQKALAKPAVSPLTPKVLPQ